MSGIPATGTARIRIKSIKDHGPAIRAFVQDVRSFYKGNSPEVALVRQLRDYTFDVDEGWLEMPVADFAAFNELHEKYRDRNPDPAVVYALETLHVEFV